MILQDLSGTVYGKDGHLKVLGKTGQRHGRAFYYWVKCSVCAKDPEMYGDGLFKSLASQIKKGVVPCGCSKKHAKSEQQWALRAVRACEGTSWVFLGFAGEFKGEATRANFKCIVDGHEWEAGIRSFSSGRGCFKCASRALEVPEEAYYERFKASGVFVEGTTFRKSGKRDKYGQMIWHVHCPVCAADEYTQAGLCTGVFEGYSRELERGIRSCRCSPRCHKTVQQVEYKLRQECGKRGYTFVGWLDEWVALRATRFQFSCNTHQTTHEMVADQFLNMLYGCPDCGGGSGGFDKDLLGWVYVLRTRCESFTGYGISNDVQTRLKAHKWELKKSNYEIGDVIYFEMPGQEALNTERSLKKTFPLNSQPITGFKTEATHAHLYDEVVAFVQSKLASLSHPSNESSCAQ